MIKVSVMFAILLVSSSAFAVEEDEDIPTPQEIVQKVHQVARYLSRTGASGIAAFNRQQSRYVWGDTYVFVFDCVRGKNVANPVNPYLMGQSLEDIKDMTGRVIGPLFCEDHGGKGYWVEYQWPKPGQTQSHRKLTYVEPVPGTPYTVSAGIYDDDYTISLYDLGRLSSNE